MTARGLVGGCRVLATLALVVVATTATAQDHPCESDAVRTRGLGEKAYRKECCEQRRYRRLSDVARDEGIVGA